VEGRSSADVGENTQESRQDRQDRGFETYGEKSFGESEAMKIRAIIDYELDTEGELSIDVLERELESWSEVLDLPCRVRVEEVKDELSN
jgi:hypothetical protein